MPPLLWSFPCGRISKSSHPVQYRNKYSICFQSVQVNDFFAQPPIFLITERPPAGQPAGGISDPPMSKSRAAGFASGSALSSAGEDITAARPLSPTVSQEMERSVSPGASSWGTPRRSLHPVSSRPDVLKTHHFYEGFLLLQICCFFLSGLFSRILQLFGFLLNNFDL